jgi:hypothetical protein
MEVHKGTGDTERQINHSVPSTDWYSDKIIAYNLATVK